MNREDFYNLVKDEVAQYLPVTLQGSPIEIKEIVKTNDILLHGLIVHAPAMKMVPTLYLDNYYEKYSSQLGWNSLIRQIARDYEDAIYIRPLDKDLNLKFNQARTNIVCQLLEMSHNTKRLENLEYYPLSPNFAMVFALRVGCSEEGDSRIMITKELAKAQKYDMDLVRKTSIENGLKKDPVTFSDMGKIISNLMGDEKRKFSLLSDWNDGSIEIDQMENAMFVLSNTSGLHGAVVLFFPGVMQKIRYILNQDYYVLPSSIHEFIIIPHSFRISLEELQKMVKEVNATTVSAEEVLSDEVYFYSLEKDTLEVAKEK